MFTIKVYVEACEDGTTEVLEYNNHSRDDIIFDAGRLLGERSDVSAIELSDDVSGETTLLYDAEYDDFDL